MCIKAKADITVQLAVALLGVQRRRPLRYNTKQYFLKESPTVLLTFHTLIKTKNLDRPAKIY